MAAETPPATGSHLIGPVCRCSCVKHRQVEDALSLWHELLQGVQPKEENTRTGYNEFVWWGSRGGEGGLWIGQFTSDPSMPDPANIVILVPDRGKGRDRPSDARLSWTRIHHGILIRQHFRHNSQGSRPLLRGANRFAQQNIGEKPPPESLPSDEESGGSVRSLCNGSSSNYRAVRKS
ncbi:hypothetical protein BGZ63DRAFT_383212 [Mariannaea sp. PMI_226]|nr:hypothetical protein BGZ63DRAFT_383212 [Mariannaea sp. PMI_226]